MSGRKPVEVRDLDGIHGSRERVWFLMGSLRTILEHDRRITVAAWNESIERTIRHYEEHPEDLYS